jgi:hypothetical protein
MNNLATKRLVGGGSWCVLGLATVVGAGVGCRGGGDAGAARPHVQHVNLPTHQVWRVVSVQPYEGLEEVELVKVNWPTANNPRMAFALTREDLKKGDPICLDHVEEIDTLWAHPVPDGGCQARDAKPASP